MNCIHLWFQKTKHYASIISPSFSSCIAWNSGMNTATNRWISKCTSHNFPVCLETIPSDLSVYEETRKWRKQVYHGSGWPFYRSRNFEKSVPRNCWNTAGPTNSKRWQCEWADSKKENGGKKPACAKANKRSRFAQTPSRSQSSIRSRTRKLDLWAVE